MVLFATSCGATEIDDVLLLEAIEAEVLPEYPGLLEDLSCPTPIEVGVGIGATCTAAIDGEAVEIEVMQTNDEGAVTADLQETLFDVVAAADKLAERFEFELGVATAVDCGEPPLRVVKVGMTLRCVADDGDRNRQVELTIVNESGAYELSLP